MHHKSSSCCGTKQNKKRCEWVPQPRFFPPWCIVLIKKKAIKKICSYCVAAGVFTISGVSTAAAASSTAVASVGTTSNILLDCC